MTIRPSKAPAGSPVYFVGQSGASMISLPIDAVVPALRQALGAQHQAVLEAPPGAGKTTRVPLALLDEPWLAGQRILMLEPRRLAARAAAERLAAELGEKVGETVGYRIRLESRVGPKTRIEVVTEGILARRLQDDPALDGVGLVIFDEFHERSLDADLALALTLNGRELLRDEPPLKVLVMSATLEGERLAALLGEAPVVRSEGRMFPVDIRWGRPAQPGEFIEPRVQQAVLQALAEESGSVLVFLPGQAEIRRVHEGLREALGGRPEVLLCPLHGELDLAAQRAAIEPASRGTRKVVLATNIAETSLTIDGVRVVIDAGLARVPRFDPGSGMTRLETQRISRASATQRAGRAGRLEPGVCYRLWSESQHEQLPAYGTAEILQADLAGLALQLARWGVAPEELAWLDAPPAAAYAQAREPLGRLGALNASGALSAHGQAMAELPTHPRIAHLLLRGQALGLGELACDVAALLGERDIQRGGGADLHSRLALLAGEARTGASRGAVQRARQLARQFRGYLRGAASEAVVDPGHPRWLGCLLAFAYPDRIARQRRAGGGDYRLANGRAAQFGEPDSLMKQPWLVIADLGSRQGQREERIYLAAELDPRLFDTVLAEQVSQRDEPAVGRARRRAACRAPAPGRRTGAVQRGATRPRRSGAQPGAARPGPAQGPGARCPGPRNCASGRRASACCAGWTWKTRARASGRTSATPRCWNGWRNGCRPISARSPAWLTSPTSTWLRSSPGCCPGHYRSVSTSGRRKPWKSPPARASAWTTAKPRRSSRCACRNCSASATLRASPRAAWQ